MFRSVLWRVVSLTTTHSCTEGGLGDELARQYHAKGDTLMAVHPRSPSLMISFPEFRVFATSRKLESMEGLRDLGIETFILDVTKAGNIAELRKHIEELTGGTLNILVNNAYVPCLHRKSYYPQESLALIEAYVS